MNIHEKEKYKEMPNTEERWKTTCMDDNITLLDPGSIRDWDLTKAQKDSLFLLNLKLSEIEVHIRSEMEVLIKIGESRIADINDWVGDYEIDLFITFLLDENDPDFSTETDNIIIQHQEVAKGKDWEFTLADGINHNADKDKPDYPFRNEFHCWLFYELLEKRKLGLANILRIGGFWIDVKMSYQKVVEL